MDKEEKGKWSCQYLWRDKVSDFQPKTTRKRRRYNKRAIKNRVKQRMNLLLQNPDIITQVTPAISGDTYEIIETLS